LLETSDGTGCTVQSATFIINEPTEVTISVVTTDLLCAGDCANFYKIYIFGYCFKSLTLCIPVSDTIRGII